MLSKFVLYLIPVIWITLVVLSIRANHIKLKVPTLEAYHYWSKRHMWYMFSAMPFGIASGFLASQLIQQY